MTKIPVLDAEQIFESRTDVEYTTSARSFELDRGILWPSPGSPTSDFCKRDRFWEIKDPLIKQTAERIRRSSRDIGDFLLNTFSWVRENVKLRDPQPIRHGAAFAIRELAGDCDELSDLFIALCRSAGVPCRRVVGLFCHGRDSERRSFDWHAWAEVQTADRSWVPFDPSLNFYATITERHIARCCMGRRSDYPIRRLTWRSRPQKSLVMNDDDIESAVVLPD